MTEAQARADSCAVATEEHSLRRGLVRRGAEVVTDHWATGRAGGGAQRSGSPHAACGWTVGGYRPRGRAGVGTLLFGCWLCPPWCRGCGVSADVRTAGAGLGVGSFRCRLRSFRLRDQPGSDGRRCSRASRPPRTARSSIRTAGERDQTAPPGSGGCRLCPLILGLGHPRVCRLPGGWPVAGSH
jgi:hypothetical protein